MGKKKICGSIKIEYGIATFVNLIFRNFACNDDLKTFFCIVGTSWIGRCRVEWDWHMGMTYLTSLNPQLPKKKHMLGISIIFLFNFFYIYFATRPRPSKVYQNPSISWTKKIKVISCDWTRALSVPDQGKLGRSSWIQNWSRPSPRSDCVPAENFNRWSFENKYF